MAAGDRLGSAAMRAWRQNDTSAAIALLERAIALLPAGQRRAELLWELAVALRLAGRPVEADVALTRAESDAADTGAGPIASRVAIERARVALLAGEIELADAAEAIDLGDRRAGARGRLARTRPCSTSPGGDSCCRLRLPFPRGGSSSGRCPLRRSRFLTGGGLRLSGVRALLRPAPGRGGSAPVHRTARVLARPDDGGERDRGAWRTPRSSRRRRRSAGIARPGAVGLRRPRSIARRWRRSSPLSPSTSSAWRGIARRPFASAARASRLSPSPATVRSPARAPSTSLNCCSISVAPKKPSTMSGSRRSRSFDRTFSSSSSGGHSGHGCWRARDGTPKPRASPRGGRDLISD